MLVLTTLASDIGVTCGHELWWCVGEEAVSISPLQLKALMVIKDH